MSILDNSTDLPVPKTERRTRKPATDNQRMAGTENFALFLLNGIKASLYNQRAAKIFSRTATKNITDIVNWEISRIKDMQAMRKKGK